jgi:hypothetical protein
MRWQQSWTESLLLRYRALDYIPSMLADRSVGPYPISLPLSTKEVVEKATQLSMVGY